MKQNLRDGQLGGGGRIPLNLTNHTQGDRKTETVIRLTGAAYVYQNTSHKRNARMGQDPRLGPYRVAMIKTGVAEA